MARVDQYCRNQGNYFNQGLLFRLMLTKTNSLINSFGRRNSSPSRVSSLPDRRCKSPMRHQAQISFLANGTLRTSIKIKKIKKTAILTGILRLTEIYLESRLFLPLEHIMLKTKKIRRRMTSRKIMIATKMPSTRVLHGQPRLISFMYLRKSFRTSLIKPSTSKLLP